MPGTARPVAGQGRANVPAPKLSSLLCSSSDNLPVSRVILSLPLLVVKSTQNRRWLLSCEVRSRLQ